MQTTTGDLWAFSKYNGWLVVPTNLDVRRDGLAIMGRGVARQACAKVRGLREYYGGLLRQGRTGVEPMISWRPGSSRKLVLFPVKRHWYEPASLELIEKSARELAVDPRITGQVFLPIVGIGYGQLEEAAVLPVLERHLTDERFILVHRGEGVVEAYPAAFREGRYRDLSLGRGAA